MRDRHTTITPAPVNRDAPATIGDACQIVDEHEAECARLRSKEDIRKSEKSSDQQGVVWARIVALEQGTLELRTNVKMVAKLFVLALSLAAAFTGVGIFVARYAIVGAITLELDKRLPPIGTKAALPAPPSHHAQIPWSPIPSAHASLVEP